MSSKEKLSLILAPRGEGRMLNCPLSDIFDQINAYAAGAPSHMINPEAYR